MPATPICLHQKHNDKKSSKTTAATHLVFDGVDLAVVTNVLVLSDPVVAAGRFLLNENSVFLGSGVAEAAVAHVEALLLDDLGQAGVAVELGSGQDHAGQRSQEEGLEQKK